MKRLLLASVGLVAMTSASAWAADIPSRLPLPARAPVYVPVFMWTGVYAGINFGYGFGTSRWSNTFGFTTGDFDLDGWVVGGTLGYNMQLGSVIASIETDLAWSNIKGSTATLCAPNCQTELRSLGTVRGRLGYALDRFLPYIAGGMAYGNVEASQNPFFSANETRVGWTIGGGLEYAFMHNWTVRLEYLYVDLGTFTCDATCAGGLPFDVSFTSSIIRGGINYKF